MLFQSKVPLKFWVEAFFTTNFLINLLPTSTIEAFVSPYEKLYKKTTDYTALRSFGCACFPTLRDYAVNKFDPRSLNVFFWVIMTGTKATDAYIHQQEGSISAGMLFLMRLHIPSLIHINTTILSRELHSLRLGLKVLRLQFNIKRQ